MDELLVEQDVYFNTIKRTLQSFRKRPHSEITLGVVEGRRQQLINGWKNCQRLDVKINAATRGSDKSLITYFSSNMFVEVEETYFEALDTFNALIDKMKREEASSNSSASRSHENLGSTSDSSRSVKLPRINLPTFSGNYLEWQNFKNLFLSIIASDVKLPDVQKMHYLKSSLQGEAALLIKHLGNNDENYKCAWEVLTKRYENQRAIVNSYLNTFMSVPPILNNETVDDLRNLRNTTSEVVQALKGLGRRIEGDLLVFIVARKMGRFSLMEWEKFLGDKTEYPTYESLDNFLATRIRTLEALQSAKEVRGTSNQSSVTQEKKIHHKIQNKVAVFTTTTSNDKCIVCNGEHYLYRCDHFNALGLSQKKEIVKENHLCFNCLKPGHILRNCRSKVNCLQCQKRHHTTLHNVQIASSKGLTQPHKLVQTKVNKPPNSLKNSNSLKNEVSSKDDTVVLQHMRGRNVLLATTKILVSSNNGNRIEIRALLDQGSEMTFISEKLAQVLRCKRRPTMIRVTGIDGVFIGNAKSQVNLSLSSIYNDKMDIPISALVLSKLNNYNLSPVKDFGKWNHLHHLELADPLACDNNKIEMIIGADYYGSLLLPGVVQGPIGSPTAQSTLFGWIISGPTNSPLNKVSHHHITIDDLQKNIQRFWEIEEFPQHPIFSDDDKKCEEHFINTFSRTCDGKYMVRLPFKNERPEGLGNSLKSAISLLAKTEYRLNKNLNLKHEYYSFLKEYQILNHMIEIDHQNENLNQSTDRVYLPHHPIIRENSATTHLRVVFNGSYPTSTGISLNNQLLIGPKLQSDIKSLILRWRNYRYVLTADISKMFRRILIDPRDRNYQCIVCKLEPDGEVKHFQLATVTYGTTSAPFLANRVIKQLAEDEGTNFPKAKAVLLDNIYVDDAVFGADDIETARQLKDDVIKLLAKGGFPVHKVYSNSIALQDKIKSSTDTKLNLNERNERQQAVLGLFWNADSDEFQINFKKQEYQTFTKRIVLSIISRLFDPLGWVSPIIVISKIFMQELWLKGLEWDERLPEDLLSRWNNFYHELMYVQKISIPRWTGKFHDSQVEIHGFADASQRAYAAVVYQRVTNSNGEPSVSILISKTKVAPIKPTTIPRLELCAVQLLAKLLHQTIIDLKLEQSSVYAYTDSTIVLAWLAKHPSTWNNFVANRVANVHSLIPSVVWRHVSSTDNPADCASRGLIPSELKDYKLWWSGPKWLSSPSINLPTFQESDLQNIEELKSTSTHVTKTKLINEFADQILIKCNNWPKLLKITALCFKFINQCKRSLTSKTIVVSKVDELRTAKLFWLKLIQTLYFSNEIREIRNNIAVKGSSPLRNLNPFVDKDGLLRVSGRLHNAPITWDAKHPVILPKHEVSEWIAKQAHSRSLHGGQSLTLFLLRQNFWILRARDIVRNITYNCITCVRQRAELQSQLMSNLPAPRVTPSKPFTHTGVDYAGPLVIKMEKKRGYTPRKAYIALFVCMVTRAVHVELVSDYSTACFLASFKRFVSRRGLPSHLYSDNGKNFVGADKELRRIFQTVSKDSKVQDFLSQNEIVWQFNPPYAPHFGGLWEAGVKSVKRHLNRIMGTQIFNFEELTTVLCEIEACLNSRPLSAISKNADDFSYLTPGHFLTGSPLLAVPESTLPSTRLNRLNHWQLVQLATEQFWKQWTIECQQELQRHYKWTKTERNIQVGDLVVIREYGLPKSKWHLGRVLICHPGRDGLVRVVSLKTANGICKRPVTQLCLLPVHDQDKN